MGDHEDSDAVLLSTSFFQPSQQSSSLTVEQRCVKTVVLHCPYCSRAITGNSSKGLRTRYNRHLLTHTKERPYRCEFCLARFTTSTNRRRHLLKLHREMMTTCSVSSTTTSTRQETPVDMDSAIVTTGGDTDAVNLLSTEIILACRFCNAEFSCKGSRTLHERHCPSRTYSPCVVSATSLSTSSTPTEVVGSSSQLTENPADTFFLCPNCEQELSGRQQLKRHLKCYCPFREDAFASCEDDDDDDMMEMWREKGMRSRTKRSRRILSRRRIGSAERYSRHMRNEAVDDGDLTGTSVVSLRGAESIVSIKRTHTKGTTTKTVVCPYDDCMSTFASRTRWLSHVARRHPHELVRNTANLIA